jgi:hypothetical protein
LQKVLTNNFKFKKQTTPLYKDKSLFAYSEVAINREIYTSLRARVLALFLFLYYFIENGTLGLFPEKYYFLYRNVRISDLILYILIAYSFARIGEYKDLFKSKPLLIVKIILFYLALSFGISAIRYQFNVIEYFFRLKGLWSSFLVFPFLLLLKRNGLSFFIKLIFPIAIISNILYILSAITGFAFLPDVSIVKQRLPGGFEVYRVYSGTFFGDVFFLAFVYHWITNRFRFYQLALAVLFIIPHILAFGRSAWAFFAFAIILMILLNSLRKRDFKVLFRQAIILGLLILTLIIAFIKFIPESDYYIDAIKVRLFQGQEDVKYSEGTYGARVLFQNDALVKLWKNSNLLFGIGMHPMWVYRPESFEEQVYYNAFSDVVWPSVLAAYGIIGFTLAAIFQVLFLIFSFKLVKKRRGSDIITMFITLLFAKMIFDSFINFSYALFTVNLWGLFGSICFYVPIVIYAYEQEKQLKQENHHLQSA